MLENVVSRMKYRSKRRNKERSDDVRLCSIIASGFATLKLVALLLVAPYQRPRRRPLFLENIEADVAVVIVHVGVKYFRQEFDRRG